jgi:Fic family protein
MIKTQTTPKPAWIWQHPAYPHFRYDAEALAPLMQKITLEQGKLIAYLSVMDAHNIKKTQLYAMENEIIASCAIEGEILNRDSVRSSIQEKLGLTQSVHYRSKNKEDHYVDILIDANTNYGEALSLERIFAWHHGMFGEYDGYKMINIASLRSEGTMQVVSGAIGREKVYYEAPPYQRLTHEMDAFIEWYNAAPATLTKAAIAHLWFVIIHPLDDGNGRIARAITDMVLSQIEHSHISKLYTMSKSINDDRKSYYNALEHTTGYIKKSDPMDITLWCTWFFEMLHKALLDAQTSLSYIIDKTKFWDKHKESRLNARQTKVINKILDMGRENFEGGLSRKKYTIIADTTSATASRDITDLLEKGCIQKIKSTQGKNTRYEILIPTSRSSS